MKTGVALIAASRARARLRSCGAGSAARSASRTGRGAIEPARRRRLADPAAAATAATAATTSARGLGGHRRRPRGRSDCARRRDSAPGGGSLHAGVAAQVGPTDDAQHRLEPGDDRLPLREVGLGLRVGQVEHGQALLDAAHVGLRLAQDADERQLAGRAPRSRAPRRRAVRASRRMPTAAILQRPLATRGSAISSAKQSAADSRSKIELQTGIRIDVGEGDDARQVEAAQAARACRGRRGARPPAAAGRASGRPPSRRSARCAAGRWRLRERSHDWVDCWRSTSPSITAHAAFAKYAARCVASVLLPLPPLRLTTAMTGMTKAGPQRPILQGNGPGQNVTGRRRRGKDRVVFSIGAVDPGAAKARKAPAEPALQAFRGAFAMSEPRRPLRGTTTASPAAPGAGRARLYRDYHDREWGFPVDDDRRLFEKLCLEGFQAGLSWLTILNKREAFRRAFAGLRRRARRALRRRATSTRLLGDAGIVRHRGKIESTINNARRVLELRDEFGSLAAYVWRFEPAPASRPKRMTLAALQALRPSRRGDGAVEGPEAARLELRRADHGLRLHAGDGPGQRPPRRLPRPRCRGGGGAAGAALTSARVRVRLPRSER